MPHLVRNLSSQVIVKSSKNAFKRNVWYVLYNQKLVETISGSNLTDTEPPPSSLWKLASHSGPTPTGTN